MKEIFEVVLAEAEQAGPRVRIEFRDPAEAKESSPAQDPYAWISTCDRWMIGAREDKACRDFVYAMIDRRARNGVALSGIYAASVLPPPLNIIVMVGAIVWRLVAQRA